MPQNLRAYVTYRKAAKRGRRAVLSRGTSLGGWLMGRETLQAMRRGLDRYRLDSEEYVNSDGRVPVAPAGAADAHVHLHFEDFCANATSVAAEAIVQVGLRLVDMGELMRSVPPRQGATKIVYDLSAFGTSVGAANEALAH